MKLILLLLIFSMLALIISGCSEEVERENPFDAQNERTGGAPPGLKARAGDSQVTLSWTNIGLAGIKEYKIYRSYQSKDDFQYVNSVSAKPSTELAEYSYTDKGLKNDGDNVYFYRISYVDDEGIETPDPESLPKKLSYISIIPSLAPPAPEVQVLEDKDLKVRLIWAGYIDTAPDDLAGFRIYSALKAEEGQEQPPLTLVAEIDDPKVEFYVDGNDYPNNIINFVKDGTSKLYKVTSFDMAGVESDSPILVGTSPNLPPSPPAQLKGYFSLGINSYEVRLEWRRNLEPDIAGYKVYALLPDGTQEFKEWKRDPNATVSIIQDRYVVVGGFLATKQYFVTAFDNTPRPDGLTDESEPSQIISAM